MDYFSGQCLIAMPGMQDDRFERAVIYVCSHTPEGAMGLVVNKPLRHLTFDDLLAQLHIARPENPVAPSVMAGGPVDVARGFVLHSPEYTGKATLAMTGLASLSVTTDVIGDIAAGKGPEKYLIALGYVGWGAGQLENEIKENSWTPVPADADLVYSLPNEKKWSRAFASLGVDPSFLSDEQGKA